MILQALTRLYEDLAAQGKIPRPGWSPAKISCALCIDGEGRLIQVVPLLVETTSGKKTVLRPQMLDLPAPVKRSRGIDPNFLWDNSSYILGFDDKGKPQRSLECFQACRALHHQLLDDVDSPAAKAVLNFFDHWEPAQAADDLILSGHIEELMKGANLVFRVDGEYPHEDPMIQAAWNRHYSKAEGEQMQCLVTGENDVIEAVHPSIKGVNGAQSSGAALVSFNAPAFCSYGKEQNLNAPVGKHAAFAYTSALNYLLADRENVQRIGETTVVCWAEGAEAVYTQFSWAALFGGTPPNALTDDDLHSAVKRLASGLPCQELALDPNRPFYILGIAPNTARLSVRFFHRDSFGAVMRNVNDHHERLEIAGKRFPYMPLWTLLAETVNPHSSDKSPSPVMAGATARAIFSGTPYPAALLEAATLRIRAEREITPGRAAIIKAYYLKNPHEQCPEEVLTVSLNENSTNVPYTLGRLFYVYEHIQEEANPGINATIKDKYFNSAASIPGAIFPVLGRLSKSHLRKLESGRRVHFERLVGQLKDILGESYPLRLTLQEQGSFDLGYYHQKQFRYTKKEDK